MLECYYSQDVFPINEKQINEKGEEVSIFPNLSRLRVTPKNQDEEHVFGVTLYREEEDIYSFTPYESIVNEYINLEIKKFFGYTLDEYLNKNFYEVSVLRNKAIMLKEEISKALEAASKETSMRVSDGAAGVIQEEQDNMFQGEI